MMTWSGATAVLAGVPLHGGLDIVSRVGPAESGSRIASCERGFDLAIAVTGVGGQIIGCKPPQIHDRHRRW
jgi:hypothetical protein